MTSIVVVSAGVSTPSSTRLLADRLSQAVVDRMRVRDLKVEVTLLEVRDMAMDVTAAAIGGGRRSAAVEHANVALSSADAVTAVTPVFSGSYSGLFKSFFDVIDPGALRGTPILIAASGGSQRHSLVLDHALRPLFAYFGAVVMPTGVFAATSDFGGSPSDDEALGERIGRAAEELSSFLAMKLDGRGEHGTLDQRGVQRRADELSQAESLESSGALSDFGALLPPLR